MFEKLNEDYMRYIPKCGNILRFILYGIKNSGFRAMILHRMGYWCRNHRMRFVASLLDRVMHHLCLCYISSQAEIDGGLKIPHTIGLVIGSGTIIGKNCDVRQNVTFGGNYEKTGQDGRKMPKVGDNVSVGAGAVIIGPVTIGSNTIVGANAVVTKDFPENVIIGGVPAQVVKQRWDEATGRRL